MTVTRKGGGRATLALPAPTGNALDTYLAHRADAAGVAVGELGGPLLATAHGRRVDQKELWRLVQRLARTAGIPAWARLTPHSMRHTAIMLALDAGASLRDVQDFAGHRDPRTTRATSTRGTTWTATPLTPSPPTSADGSPRLGVSRCGGGSGRATG